MDRMKSLKGFIQNSDIIRTILLFSLLLVLLFPIVVAVRNNNSLLLNAFEVPGTFLNT